MPRVTALAFCVAVLLPWMAEALEPTTVTVDGAVVVTEKTEGNLRERALRVALEEAVFEVARLFQTPDSLEFDEERVREALSPRAPAFVLTYRLDGVPRRRVSRLDPSVEEYVLGRTATVDAAPGLGPELPAGPVRDRVAPAIGIRRLLPQVTVATRRKMAPLLDELDKTIGRVFVERRTALAPRSRKPIAVKDRVVLTALRGFDREVRSVAKALAAVDGVKKDKRRELDVALRAIGRAAGDYASKLRLALTADMPGTAGVADIFEHLFDWSKNRIIICISFLLIHSCDFQILRMEVSKVSNRTSKPIIKGQ